MKKPTYKQLFDDFVKPYAKASFDYSSSRREYYMYRNKHAECVDMGQRDIRLALKYSEKFRKFYAECEAHEQALQKRDKEWEAAQ